MKRILAGIVILGAFTPAATYAQDQPPTCEQRLAVMGQLIEDMSRARATVNLAEIEAASLKVQVKALQSEIKANEKKPDEKKAD